MHALAKIYDAVDTSNLFLGRFWKIRQFPFGYLRFFIESEPIHHTQMPMDAVVNISFSLGASKYKCNARLIIAFRHTLICRIPDQIYSVDRRAARRLNLFEPFIVTINFQQNRDFFCRHLEFGHGADANEWLPRAINLSKDGLGLRVDHLKRSFLPFLGQDFPEVFLTLRSPSLVIDRPFRCSLRLKNVAVREESHVQDGDLQLSKNRFAYCGFQFTDKEAGLDEAITHFVNEMSEKPRKKQEAG